MTNQTLYSTITFEVSTPTPISEKTAHLLRRELQEALDDAALVVLDKFGIIQENIHTVDVEEIEVAEPEEID